MVSDCETCASRGLRPVVPALVAAATRAGFLKHVQCSYGLVIWKVILVASAARSRGSGARFEHCIVNYSTKGESCQVIDSYVKYMTAASSSLGRPWCSRVRACWIEATAGLSVLTVPPAQHARRAIVDQPGGGVAEAFRRHEGAPIRATKVSGEPEVRPRLRVSSLPA